MASPFQPYSPHSPHSQMHNWAQGPASCELIQQKCEVSKYNLGARCLTSKKTKATYRKYLHENPDFQKEIEDNIGNVLKIDNELVQAAEQIEAEAVTATDSNNDLYIAPSDNTAVLLQHVIRESLSPDIPAASLPGNKTFCVAADTVVVGDTGSLQGGGDTENIWAYSDNGLLFREGLLPSDM
ncbi:hypothetical protein K438DRAFT_1750085 [Mycena galopus ATCC 62051]|nr:hypothetical protein K438DRAFT_1750085 [Mycena galopus ATCC 62051]